MLCMAAGCAGEVAVIWVDDTTVKLVAATAPKTTLVAPVKPVPVIVTLVPPAGGPDVGEIEVTVGAAAVTTDPATTRPVLSVATHSDGEAQEAPVR